MKESLLLYYQKCFALIDHFHFNSEQTGTIFKSYIKTLNGTVIPITHREIKDQREIKTYDSLRNLHLGFIGNLTTYKGFPLLRNILSTLYNNGEVNWDLSVWGGNKSLDKDLPIIYKGKFNKENIKEVYKKMDVLIVPSIWNETFSLVTLEALSYGTPVIVSKHVGAQDLVKTYSPECVYNTKKDLKELISKLLRDRTLLIDYNQLVCNKPWHFNAKEHAQRIIDEIYLEK